MFEYEKLLEITTETGKNANCKDLVDMVFAAACEFDFSSLRLLLSNRTNVRAVVNMSVINQRMTFLSEIPEVSKVIWVCAMNRANKAVGVHDRFEEIYKNTRDGFPEVRDGAITGVFHINPWLVDRLGLKYPSDDIGNLEEVFAETRDRICAMDFWFSRVRFAEVGALISAREKYIIVVPEDCPVLQRFVNLTKVLRLKKIEFSKICKASEIMSMAYDRAAIIKALGPESKQILVVAESVFGAAETLGSLNNRLEKGLPFNMNLCGSVLSELRRVLHGSTA